MGKLNNPLDKIDSSETGLMLPENLKWRDWRVLVDGYVEMAKRVPWIIGDLLVYGEEHYGEDMAQATDELLAKSKYSQGTIYNLVYVSRNVGPRERNKNLSHGFHYEVAKMDPEEQVAWLARAEIEGWTVMELRNGIKGKHGKEESKQEPEPQRVEEENREQEPDKPYSRGRINDAFDMWWDWYNSGKYYGEEFKAVARDGWNAEVDSRRGLI